ncbi:MAG TPA: GNAT family N-acetyltransferase [Iamia sp.]|jgi:ribosomal protein S18 acetylase RimI-like enzyme|nr:GNAT family N-acetyltransferase [Iamia sp.]
MSTPSAVRARGAADPAHDPLANAVWHSLAGGHADLAERRGAAARYPRDVTVFAAVPDRPEPAAWTDLGHLVGPGRRAVLFRSRVEVPEGWSIEQDLRGVQLVAPAGIGALDGQVVALTEDDRDEAGALVDLTRPGPWRPRTIEMGRYVGIRRRGRLVAMAGERLRPTGHVELSAVCTAPDARGRGLASRLVRHLVAAIEGDGAVAFLHAAADNHPAIRLYEELGFVPSREVTVTILRAAGAPAR